MSKDVSAAVSAHDVCLYVCNENRLLREFQKGSFDIYHLSRHIHVLLSGLSSAVFSPRANHHHSLRTD